MVPVGDKVWSDLVYKTALAKTKGEFNAVNANKDGVKLEKPDVQAIIGFMVCAAQAVSTDAENIPDLLIEINSKALGISNEVVVASFGGDDSDANARGTPTITQFIPFKVKDEFKPKLFNATITFKVAPSVTNTGGFDVVIAVIYSNQEPDDGFAMELLAQMPGWVTGGDAKSDAAKAHGTSGGAVTLTSLLIPAGTFQLRGLFAKLLVNGITAAKGKAGFMEFFTGGIPDFAPQLWPHCIGWNAAVGTVADEKGSAPPGRYYPTRFPLTGAEITVGVKSTLVIAATTAPDTTQAISYE